MLMGKVGGNSLTLLFQKSKLVLHMGDFICPVVQSWGTLASLSLMQTP